MIYKIYGGPLDGAEIEAKCMIGGSWYLVPIPLDSSVSFKPCAIYPTKPKAERYRVMDIGEMHHVENK